MIKVLIVEDSAVVRRHIEYILSSDQGIQVIGQAANAQEALDFLESRRPDVITMDIQMPDMDGFEATRRIMETKPVPIVIVSAGWNPMEVEKTFHAMEAGAVTLLEKPAGIGSPDFAKNAAEFNAAVKQSAVANVTRLRPRGPAALAVRAVRPVQRKRRVIEVVALGASTGGPLAIQQFLAGLPREFALPVLIVQHISKGFTRGFVDWLNGSSPLQVYVATQGEHISGGRVYVAPEGTHMGVNHGRSAIKLTEDPPEHSMRPAASYLFRSVLHAFRSAAAGILLTGMGVDGAAELKEIRDAGGITFAQDKKSSIIHGMPGEAIRLDGATYVLPPNGIADILAALVKKPNGRKP